MQTRAEVIHLLDGGAERLHFRPATIVWHRLEFSRPVAVQIARTTKSKICIGRVEIHGHKPSPWFELKDKSQAEIEKLAQWWMSGAALCNIMLR